MHSGYSTWKTERLQDSCLTRAAPLNPEIGHKTRALIIEILMEMRCFCTLQCFSMKIDDDGTFCSLIFGSEKGVSQITMKIQGILLSATSGDQLAKTPQFSTMWGPPVMFDGL